MIRVERVDGQCTACREVEVLVNIFATPVTVPALKIRVYFGRTSGQRILCLEHARSETWVAPALVTGNCTSCGARGLVHEYGRRAWGNFARDYSLCVGRCMAHLTDRVAELSDPYRPAVLGDVAEWDHEWVDPIWWQRAQFDARAAPR